MTTPEARTATVSAPAGSTKPCRLPLLTWNDFLWLLYLYPIRWLGQALPRPFLYALGRLADPLVQLHLRERKVKAVPWITTACGTTPERARQIVSGSLTGALFATLDDLVLARGSADSVLHCHSVEGREHLQSALGRGKGVLLLMSHFHANPAAFRYLASKGHNVLIVLNRQPTNTAEGWLGRKFVRPQISKLRQLAIPDHAYIQDPDCTLAIMRRLRAGGLVAIPLDGRAGTNPVECSFLGKLRHVASGIFEIVRLSDCAVVPMMSMGRSDGFRIHFDPMLETVAASSRDAFLRANLSQFLTILERQITSHPEEWRLWNQSLAWRV
jgi:lauroyl/myristoyl acyltransferase